MIPSWHSTYHVSCLLSPFLCSCSLSLSLSLSLYSLYIISIYFNLRWNALNFSLSSLCYPSYYSFSPIQCLSSLFLTHTNTHSHNRKWIRLCNSIGHSCLLLKLHCLLDSLARSPQISWFTSYGLRPRNSILSPSHSLGSIASFCIKIVKLKLLFGESSQLYCKLHKEVI